LRALFLTLLFACGPKPQPQPPPNTGSGSAIASPKPNPDGPSAQECHDLFTHAFAIVSANAAEADAKVAAQDVEPAFVADCRAGTRAYQQCGLAAKTQAELEACR
jgi:hypothetical protein